MKQLPQRCGSCQRQKDLYCFKKYKTVKLNDICIWYLVEFGENKNEIKN